MSPPDVPLADAADLPGLAVAAVARRLGVAPATLRTWDRRYGIGPSQRTIGAHRRYTGEDVARLDLMRRMVNAGVALGDAARAARGASLDALAGPALGRPYGVLDPWAAAPADPEDLLVAVPADAGDTRSGGGRVIAAPGSLPAARGLARAAMALDNAACTEVIRDTLDRRGVVWTWDHLLVPVLVGVGRRWEATGVGVEVEHVVSEAIIAAMASVTARLRTAVNARPVLLACADEESHSLPLFVVAAALAERRVCARVLGARVPQEALVAAVRRTGPAVVMVWSYLEQTGDLDQIATLPTLRPGPLLLVGGPGWHGSPPPGVTHVHDLTDAVTRVCLATG